MKKIRLVLLLLATMFCSNVLYAQTYVINLAEKTVAFSIDESKGIYVGDIRGEKSTYLGKFEGDEFKMSSDFDNIVLSYKNGYLYLKGQNAPFLKIEEGKTYYTKENHEGWTLINTMEGNKMISFNGILNGLPMLEYTESVPDKTHAVVIFYLILAKILAN